MSQMPKHVIDVHTHVFNNRYLPLKGIARPHLWDPLADALANILNSVTRSSYAKQEVHESLVKSLEKSEFLKDFAGGLWLLVQNSIVQTSIQVEKSSLTDAEAEKSFAEDVVAQSLSIIIAEYNKEHPDDLIIFDKEFFPELAKNRSSEKRFSFRNYSHPST